MGFSTNLKELRKGRKLTQEQLGEIIGISRSAVAMYESGEREPDFKTEESFAEFFGVTLDYLRGRNGISVSSSFSSHEQTVITAYRDQPEKQPQVDTILGVEPTILPLPTADTVSVDAAAKGEGAVTLPEILQDDIDLARSLDASNYDEN